MVHDLRAAQKRSDRGKGVCLWSMARNTAWRHVGDVMKAAKIVGPHATPKGLRHGFGIKAITSGVPLNMLQKWLGHAQLSTISIYADAHGAEAHQLKGCGFNDEPRLERDVYELGSAARNDRTDKM
jgi:integrase/recombinase XerD